MAECPPAPGGGESDSPTGGRGETIHRVGVSWEDGEDSRLTPSHLGQSAGAAASRSCASGRLSRVPEVAGVAVISLTDRGRPAPDTFIVRLGKQIWLHQDSMEPIRHLETYCVICSPSSFGQPQEHARVDCHPPSSRDIGHANPDRQPRPLCCPLSRHGLGPLQACVTCTVTHETRAPRATLASRCSRNFFAQPIPRRRPTDPLRPPRPPNGSSDSQ